MSTPEISSHHNPDPSINLFHHSSIHTHTHTFEQEETSSLRTKNKKKSISALKNLKESMICIRCSENKCY